MAGAAVKIKLMPSSPDVDLEEIQKKAEEKIKSKKGENIQFEKQPIAFGLNAIIITFAWDEGADRDILEKELSEIENVNTAETIDFRRAFG